MSKYSVLLLTPGYLAETFGHDTYFTHVDADNPLAAVALAQDEAEDGQPSACNPADWFPLLVVAGWHKDLLMEATP